MIIDRPILKSLDNTITGDPYLVRGIFNTLIQCSLYFDDDDDDDDCWYFNAPFKQWSQTKNGFLTYIYCNRNCLSVSGVLCVFHCVDVC